MFRGYKVIALCITKSHTKRSFEFIEAFHKACTDYNYKLFIYHSCSDFILKDRCGEGDKVVYELMDYSIIDTVVLFGETFHDDALKDSIVRSAQENGVPVISVCEERDDAVSFVFDYATGFEQIVRHVVEHHNARNTCMIAGGKGEHYSEERISVYKKVLADNGIEFREDRLFYGGYWWMPTNAAVDAIIASGDIPEAIICANDNMGITVCEYLAELGYKVPEDIIVTGFDGSVEAQSCVPPLTTASCNLYAATQDILKIASDIFEGNPLNNVYSSPYFIDIYNSCGCSREKSNINMGDLLKISADRMFRYQGDERAFYELSESVMECRSHHDFVLHLDKFNFYNINIFLNNDSLDESINPTTAKRETPFDDSMILLYQSHDDLTDYPKQFDRQEVIPKTDYLIDHTTNPLTFCSLSYFGVPMGYVCFSFTVDYENYVKIPQYVTSLNNIIGSYRTVRHLKYNTESVERMSKQDYLTGLSNRQGFYKELPAVVEKAQREGRSLVVATIDIDGLKIINDTYGHEEGDFAIKSVADAVANIRLKDKICGRFGGDELVVCAISEGGDDEVLLKNDLASDLQKVNGIASKPYKVSASIGICVVPSESFNFGETLNTSDEKMYIMKIGRPNRRRS